MAKRTRDGEQPTSGTGCAPNSFKRALSTTGQSLKLAWLSLASDVAAELLGRSGFDAIVIDGEHAPNDIDTVRRQVIAIELSGTAVIARTPINEPWVIKRLMDAGAQTILVPMVETAEQAEAAAAALRFPPTGTRGVAAQTRAADFGRRPGYLAEANAEACCVVQIESVRGVEQIEKIAAVPGVDALFIGPTDLSASAGFLGNPNAPEVLAMIESAIARIVATGRPCGIFAFDPVRAQRYMELGCRFVAIGSDVSLLSAGARALLGKFE